jgi:hypothetical protein
MAAGSVRPKTLTSLTAVTFVSLSRTMLAVIRQVIKTAVIRTNHCEYSLVRRGSPQVAGTDADCGSLDMFILSVDVREPQSNDESGMAVATVKRARGSLRSRSLLYHMSQTNALGRRAPGKRSSLPQVGEARLFSFAESLG